MITVMMRMMFSSDTAYIQYLFRMMSDAAEEMESGLSAYRRKQLIESRLYYSDLTTLVHVDIVKYKCLQTK